MKEGLYRHLAYTVKPQELEDAVSESKLVSGRAPDAHQLHGALVVHHIPVRRVTGAL